MIRPLTDSDKPMIDSWFRGHGGGWQIPPESMLSTTGFIAEVNGKPVFAGWLYLANSELGFMDWLVNNPDSNHEERVEGIKILTDGMFEEGKKQGLKRILTLASHPGLIEKLKGSGFFVTDSDVTILMRDS